ncbi:MAG: hypothetical protein ACTSXP_11570, partial [Promethearchaeota archaeon]
AIRLLGHMGTRFPDLVINQLPELIKSIFNEAGNIRKISLKALKILSRRKPDEIEHGLKEILKDIKDKSVLDQINEILTEIIKNRDLKEISGKISKTKELEEKPVEIIPEIFDKARVEKPAKSKESSKSVKKQGTVPGDESAVADEIKKEIGVKIEAEFSKIEKITKDDGTEIKSMKEIKSIDDLKRDQIPENEKEAKIPSSTIKIKATRLEPALKKDLERKHDVKMSKEDLLNRQLMLREQELKRREEEFKKLELEKKELDLAAKELEMQREELKKAKIEQLELQVKQREYELKEKELKLRLKELEEKEKRLKELEKKFLKDG